MVTMVTYSRKGPVKGTSSIPRPEPIDQRDLNDQWVSIDSDISRSISYSVPISSTVQVIYAFPISTAITSPLQDLIVQYGLMEHRVLIDCSRSHTTSSVLVKGTDSIAEIIVTTVVPFAQRGLTNITFSLVFVMVLWEPMVRLQVPLFKSRAEL
ncbi:hypothetical protein LWI29_000516 [Acer saccharum]|uniref:Uncharacterized protein n=1 Tax=Acer saccharum TaxID=4024 RepID=A0AA39VGH6_ACESA|nr:hypothetical protein LWI29_000516 [Acer saccharum]